MKFQSVQGTPKYADVSVNTDLTYADIEALELEISKVKDKLQQSEQMCTDIKEKQKFRLESISDDDEKVRFYTGFASLAALMTCFQFFGAMCQQADLLG